MRPWQPRPGRWRWRGDRWRGDMPSTRAGPTGRRLRRVRADLDTDLLDLVEGAGGGLIDRLRPLTETGLKVLGPSRSTRRVRARRSSGRPRSESGRAAGPCPATARTVDCTVDSTVREVPASESAAWSEGPITTRTSASARGELREDWSIPLQPETSRASTTNSGGRTKHGRSLETVREGPEEHSAVAAPGRARILGNGVRALYPGEASGYRSGFRGHGKRDPGPGRGLDSRKIRAPWRAPGPRPGRARPIPR